MITMFFRKEGMLLIYCCLIGLLRAKSIVLDKSANADSQENSSPELGEKNDSSEEIDKNDDLFKSRELYNAEFLTFTAPEEDEDDVDEKIDELLGLIKSQRVLLIEAPENTTIIEFNGEVEENENIAKSLVDQKKNKPTEAIDIDGEDNSEK